MFTRYRKRPAAAVAGMILTIWLPAANAQDLQGWTADSRVTGVQLVSVESSGTLLNFQIKNFSNSALAALVIATPDGSKHFVDYSLEELAPGAAYTLLIDSASVADVKHVISVEAIVRADGSAEGSQAEINFVRAQWIGVALETERLRQIFATPAVTRAIGDAELADLNARVGRKPVSAENAFASMKDVRLQDLSADALDGASTHEQFGFQTGVQGTRERALRALLQVKELPTTDSPGFRSRVTSMSELRQQYSDSSARMASLLKKFHSLQPGAPR